MRWSGEESELRWATDFATSVSPYQVEGIQFFGRVLDDRDASALLGPGWHPDSPIAVDGGGRAGSIWRDGKGSTFLPFDPNEVILNYLVEAYKETGDGAGRRSQMRTAAMRSYYRLRPLLPRSSQIALRRAFSRLQARVTFPRWPAETALHDLMSILLREAEAIASEPVPRIATWPGGKTWALVLTHDVETDRGLESIDRIRAIETKLSYRSSWHFVPRRYTVPDTLVERLVSDGFEIGVHGLYHDGRDLESLETLEQRLPEIRKWAKRWGAVGFRSPATHRRWDLMPLLGFDWDSSYPDTDPFEPQNGGCCSLLPFFNRDLVELPLTLPQDHTLFVILHRDESVWFEKAETIREYGGLALMNTHPDYLSDDRLLAGYERFLRAFESETELWHALPGEVSSWWRRRAQTSVERDAEGWRLAGEGADDARIVFTSPASS
jgi:hypothetical protein